MKPRWLELAAVLLAASGCVSYNPEGPAVPDVTGSYAATITLALSNPYEARTDSLTAFFELLNTGNRGIFTGLYLVPPSDSGPVGGTMAPDGSLILDTFGTPPKPVAGVPSIRAVYPWCNWNELGMPAVRGSLAGDTLRASVQATLPCVYQVNGGTEYVHTQLAFTLTAVR